MDINNNELVGVTTDFLCYWSDEHGWLHLHDQRLLEEYHKWMSEREINPRSFGMTELGTVCWYQFLHSLKTNEKVS